MDKETKIYNSIKYYNNQLITLNKEVENYRHLINLLEEKIQLQKRIETIDKQIDELNAQMLKQVDNPHLNCGDHLVVRVRLPLWVQLVINIKINLNENGKSKQYY